MLPFTSNRVLCVRGNVLERAGERLLIFLLLLPQKDGNRSRAAVGCKSHRLGSGCCPF